MPDEAYCQKFYNRTVDLINKFNPDMIYFDDTALPLWPISDVGLKIAAHYYNRGMQRNDGKLDVVPLRQSPGRIATQVHGLGHRTRRKQPDRAAAVPVRNLPGQLALRPRRVRKG
ncbi:MAG: hypothetical protein R3C45_10710 [Phycisphaerales bacterium]